MNTKLINIVLIVGIVLVAGVIGFFGWKALRVPKVSPALTEQKEFPLGTPITNMGKESEERDAVLEHDVRTINEAVQAYAEDHNGKYPESDIRNPCFGVRSCLKGVNINTKTKQYLEVVPQVHPHNTDYHYRSENNASAYCVRSATILETAIPNVFQCTADGCGKVLVSESCK
ncbi:MAG: hypothetical protein NUV61_00920 [Candidatus Azambacteria bacterium]|nr:hypothetical protein [Candidatus Azambacteria bacterium]